MREGYTEMEREKKKISCIISDSFSQATPDQTLQIVILRLCQQEQQQLEALLDLGVSLRVKIVKSTNNIETERENR